MTTASILGALHAELLENFTPDQAFELVMVAARRLVEEGIGVKSEVAA